MTKPLTHGLLLCSLLTGCTMPVSMAKLSPVAEVEYVTDLKGGNIPAKVFPAGSVVQKPGLLPARPNMTPRTGAVGAASAGAGQVGPQAGQGALGAALKTPHLRPDGDAVAFKVVPLLDDQNKLSGLLTQPSSGQATWRLVGGGGPVKVGKVTITFQSEAAYPAPAEPKRAPEAQASEVPVPEGPMPVLTPKSEKGAPMTVERTAEEAGLPATIPVGGSAALTCQVKGEDAMAFFRANPRSARASVSMALFDEAGAPVQDAAGAPLVLTTSITVL